MKNELKTLKEIIKELDNSDFILSNIEENLKAEAVKWVKSFSKERMIETRSIFMEFFNIKDEDLK